VSRRLVLVVALGAVLATTGSLVAVRLAADTLPDPTAFRPGTCRALAEPVLALARLDRDLDTATTVPTAVRGRIGRLQRQLTGAPADPSLDGAVRGLVTALGYVRLRSDTGTYDTGVWRKADDRRQALQRVCVRA
jgi:hypothetical protein